MPPLIRLMIVCVKSGVYTDMVDIGGVVVGAAVGVGRQPGATQF